MNANNEDEDMDNVVSLGQSDEYAKKFGDED